MFAHRPLAVMLALALTCWTATSSPTRAADEPPAAETGTGKPADSGEKRVTAEELEKSIQEALDALTSYSADKKGEAAEKARALLKDLDARLERLETDLKSKSQQLGEAARRKLQESLPELRRQRDKVAGHYEKLMKSTAKAWDALKKGFFDAYRSYRKSLEETEEETGTHI